MGVRKHIQNLLLYGITMLLKLRLYLLTLCGITALSSAVSAQIIPDATLPNASIVNSQRDRTTITGGTEVGSTLFHSFGTFSIPTNGSATFNNALRIQNILTRVTGNTPSNIDGLIRANGTANLFLLNPNGIVFGSNARLELGGSFTASTSDRFIFPDGSEFSATKPEAPPLLTISVPLGLQTGQPIAGSTIVNQATLSVPQNLILESDQLTLAGELTAGKDLGLRSTNPVSSDALFSSGGNFWIEQFDGSLGALNRSNGTVIRAQGDVNLSSYQGASLHVLAGGSVTIPGAITIDNAAPRNGIAETIALSDGTVVAIDGRSEPTLEVRAGMNPEATRADIWIGRTTIAQTPGIPRVGQVLLTNQGEPARFGDIQIGAIFGIGTDSDGAATTIDARRDVNFNSIVLGFSTFGNGGATKILAQNNVQIPLINTSSFAKNGGDVSIAAGGTVKILGAISTYTSQTGRAGNVQILANGDIAPGTIVANSILGDAGSVDLNSRNGGIDIGSGMIITDADAFKGGNGNQVSLSAQGDIKVAVIKASGGAGGAGGDISIHSRGGTITIENGGLSTLAPGIGDAGTITLRAAKDVVIQQSDLFSGTASTTGSNGKDITIAAGNSIFLDRTSISSSSGLESLMSSNAYFVESPFFQFASYSGTGNAGNIRLTAGQDILAKDSAIYSTAVYQSQGNAGTIALTAGNDITWQRNLLRFSYPGLYAFNRGQGNAGDILVDAKSVNLFGSGIETGVSFDSVGESGNINLKVRDRLLLDGDGWSSTITAQVKPSGSLVEAIGSKGKIAIAAGSVWMRNGAEISTGVGDVNRGYIAGGFATGNGGTIELKIRDDVALSQSFISSRIFANGTGNAGQIEIQARSISSDRAVITSSTSGVGNAGAITLTADRIDLNNSDVSSAVQPGGIGQGQDITLKARSIFLNNGTQINTVTSGSGTAGNVLLEADNVTISGNNPIRTPTNFLYGWLPPVGEDYTVENRPPGTFPSGTAPDFVDGITSGIFSSTNTESNGGNITINARSLNVGSGGQIDARTTNQGIGGTIRINANQVELSDGGQLSAITSGSGRGGTIALNADQVQIAGSDATFSDRLSQFGTETDIYGKARVSNQGATSGIFASTEPTSTGKGGEIAIDTRNLLISNNGQISVNSQGSGDGGQIQIESNLLRLDQGSILARTDSGEGGNIAIAAQNLLSLRRNSQISATANGTGNGGNIAIRTPNGFIVGIPAENSDITANAIRGRGGNIEITTQSIFGFDQRAGLTHRSDITASSEYGIDGTVKLTTLQPEPNQTSEELPQLVDSSTQIAETCSPKNRVNSFVVTGRGGLPPDPSESINATQIWQAIAPERVAGEPERSSSILEANRWTKHRDGTVELVAGEAVRSTIPTCERGQ